MFASLLYLFLAQCPSYLQGKHDFDSHFKWHGVSATSEVFKIPHHIHLPRPKPAFTTAGFINISVQDGLATNQIKVLNQQQQNWTMETARIRSLAAWWGKAIQCLHFKGKWDARHHGAFKVASFHKWSYAAKLTKLPKTGELFMTTCSSEVIYSAKTV